MVEIAPFGVEARLNKWKKAPAMIFHKVRSLH